MDLPPPSSVPRSRAPPPPTKKRWGPLPAGFEPALLSKPPFMNERVRGGAMEERSGRGRMGTRVLITIERRIDPETMLLYHQHSRPKATPHQSL